MAKSIILKSAIYGAPKGKPCATELAHQIKMQAKTEGENLESKITYAQMVQQLIKSDIQIQSELTPEDCGLMHATFGISGEAGELLDAIKKVIIYRKPIDRENLIEELGDMEFYLEDLRKRIGVTREECLAQNMSKLAKRYKAFSYTDQQAQSRNDKK